MVNILRMTDSNMIGRRFSHGPFFFGGGFCNGVKIPIDSSSGPSPVLAVSFSSSAML